MCHYRLYIWLGCGHTTLSENPVSYCSDARRKRGMLSLSERRKKRIEALEAKEAQKRRESVYASLEEFMQTSPKPEDAQNAKGEDKRLEVPAEQDTAGGSEEASVEQAAAVQVAQTTSASPLKAPPTNRSIDDAQHIPRTTSSTSDEDEEDSRPATPCREGVAHPFHIVKLERTCAICISERDERLRALDNAMHEIRFEPERWRAKHTGRARKTASKISTTSDGSTGAQVEAIRKEVRDSVMSVSVAVGDWFKDLGKKDGVGSPVP